jgi:hypothetical protein
VADSKVNLADPNPKRKLKKLKPSLMEPGSGLKKSTEAPF